MYISLCDTVFSGSLIARHFETVLFVRCLIEGRLKPGLHAPQLPVERSVTLVSFIVVERRCCALQVSSVARLEENKET